MDKPYPAQYVLNYSGIPVDGGKHYQMSVCYYAENVKENSEENKKWLRRPAVPKIRMIFKDRENSKTNLEYIWLSGSFASGTDGWIAARKIFKTPDNAGMLYLTIFFEAAGDYWLDNIRLDEF